MHIGLGPRVAGESGMQVQPLVPARSVRILPSGSIATMVAAFATPGGAAVIALAINCSSVIGAVASAACKLGDDTISDAPIRKPPKMPGPRIAVSLQFG
jgi:hypothetical protein